MFKKVSGIVAVLALMAVTASIALGGQSDKSPAQTYAAGKGSLVAKDTAKRRPAAAVARVTLNGADVGKSSVSYSVTSNPSHLPIDWAQTVRCTKGALIDYEPGPGDVHTTTRKTPFGGTYGIPLKDPDSCQFAVAGQIGANKLGHTVSVKIYNKK
jgi:hypothetical protein